MRAPFILLIALAVCGPYVLLAQWIVLPSTGDQIYYCVSFPNSNTGFIAAGASIYKTEDSGKTWTETMLQYGVRTLSFPANDVGYAGGAIVYKTTDGGESWDSIYTPNQCTGSRLIRSVAFVRENQGIIVGECLVERTIDGARTWRRCENTAEMPMYPGSAISNYAGRLMHLDSWSESELSQGSLWRSTNSGETWVAVKGWLFFPESIGMQIQTITHNGEFRIWIGGNRYNRSIWGRRTTSRVFFTTDGGETWDTTKYVFPYTVNTIAFADSLRGFIGDTAGNIYSTTDGGTTWQNDNVPSGGRSINSIAIAGGTAVYAVGDGGLILKRELVTSVAEGGEGQPMGVYPNPTHGTIRIRVGAEHIGALLTVSDMFGRTILTITVNDQDTDVDLRSYPQGTYVITMHHSRTIESRMMIMMGDR